MTLTLDPVLLSAGIGPAETQAIRHAFVREHEDTGTPGITADSTDEEIPEYTGEQSANPRIACIRLINLQDSVARAINLGSALSDHERLQHDPFRCNSRTSLLSIAL
jgi:hypothetical protein